MNKLEEIKELVNMGFTIIPLCSANHKGMTPSHIKGCQSPGKRPLVSKWTDITNVSSEQFKTWSEQFPTANWGMVLGQTMSYNLVGIDIDGDEGEKYWSELIKDKAIPDTVEFTTGAGRRLLYQLPYGLETKKQKITLDGNHAEVAFCCQGQQTVIPPSVHHTGRVYEWVPGKSPFDIDIAPAPKWIVETVKLHKNTVNPNRENTSIKVTKEELAAPIVDGNRNNQLTRVLGHVFAKTDLDYDTVLAMAQSINETKCDNPLSYDEIKTITTSIYNREREKKKIKGLYCDDKGKPIPFSLVQYILDNENIVTINGSTFLYDKLDNYYNQLTDYEVERIYYNHCANDTHKTTRNSMEFMKILKNYSDFKPVEYIEKKYINLKNGIYDVDLDILQSHDPGLKIINQFNGCYIENKVEFIDKFNKSKFKRYIDTTFESNPDVIPVIQEMLGLVLSPHAKELKKAFILKGGGDNGKSLLISLINELFRNDDLISSITFNQFGDKHATYMLVNSMINLVDDDDTIHARYLNSFKSVISGELINVNGKYKDVTNIKPNMTFITGTNNDMTFDDLSDGLLNRLVIIEFKEKFGTIDDVKNGRATHIKDTELKEYITNNEMDLVITWAIEGLKRLKNNKWILTSSENINASKEEFKENNNSIYSFAKEKLCITNNDADIIYSGDLTTAYQWYCTEWDVEPLTDKKRGPELRKLGLKPGKNKGKRCWIGAKLI